MKALIPFEKDCNREVKLLKLKANYNNKGLDIFAKSL